ncbi:T9SS type A sorting domain-containing protein [bacterium]|nr:T9SS type A sorting domain-containing protein [bacterium]
MKSTFIILSLFTFSFIATAQNVNIPDAKFKSALLAHSPTIDANSDNEISTAEAAAFAGELEILYKGIEDLTGIESFVNITGLNCTGNKLESIDLSSNTKLEEFSCGSNLLTSLDMSGNPALTRLSCPQNQIKTLNISSNINLEFLACGTNRLTSLDLSGNLALTDVYIFLNELSYLDVSENVALVNLNCSENYSLTGIKVSDKNTALEYIKCDNCSIKALKLNGLSSLEQLLAEDNDLNYLNIANGNNTNLTKLWVYDNPDLGCIQVDDSAYSRINWEDTKDIDNPFKYNGDVYFSEMCENTTSVFGTSAQDEVDFYPNPTHGLIYFEGLVNAQVINISGQIVAEGAAVNTMDISNLISGIYILELRDRDGKVIARSKVFKQ